MEQYRTIRLPYETTFIEKKSEFIGYIAPVHTEEEVAEELLKIRKAHHAARHHVPAYILRKGSVIRCSDDGEPQGTAGVPILEVLKKNELVDVLLVVTRYFGGTLLGTGGLVRAYSHTASLAVEGAEKQLFTQCDKIKLEMDYSFYGTVMNILSKLPHRMVDSRFGEAVEIELLVPEDETTPFSTILQEVSAARIHVTMEEKCFDEIG